MPSRPDPLPAALALADDALFPAAVEIDGSDVVPSSFLDALADAGLYGLFGPVSAGGFDADPVTAGGVVEALGGASLTAAWFASATPATVASARAEASLLAVRAASAVVAAGGGRSVESGQPAARLLREAMFLLVFAQTADIRAAQLAVLGALSGERSRPRR